MSLLIDQAGCVPPSAVTQDAPIERLLWLDGARTIALLGMIVFHFARDLELFGVLPAGTTLSGGWDVFARVIAGSFLFIAGLSLVLAHQDGLRVRAWAKRLVMIVGAACLISAATFVAFPERFIYFGILHTIGFASIVGLAFLRAPYWVTALFAVGVLLIGYASVDPAFHSPWLAWTGLSSSVRPSLDFIPVIPWLGPFLLGMCVAQSFSLGKIGFISRQYTLLRKLTWPGRYSLAVYLIHQPVLLGLIWFSVEILR